MATVSTNAPTSEQAVRIRLLVLDVDGVLTDGLLQFDADGRETKVFNVRDGYGIRQVLAAGIQVAVISGRSSPAVDARMAELDVKHVLLGQNDKLAALKEITEQLAIPMEAVACVGDDLPDLPLMQAVGLSVAVADAHPKVIEGANWCTGLTGGRGAVREICDLLVAAQGTGL